MAIATFDTLKFSKALRDAGVSERQAEAEAFVLAEVFSLNFKDIGTKEDLKRAVDDVEVKLRELEQRLNVKSDLLRADFRELEQRLGAKIDLQTAKFDLLSAKFDWMKWAMGILFSVCVGIAIRLFFFSAK